MLKREESNKIIGVIKTITFATGLFFLNPMDISANEKIQNEEIQIVDNDIYTDALFEFSFGNIVLLGIGTYIKLLIDIKSNPYIPKKGIRLGENDSCEEKIKQLKLVNSREANDE